VGGLWWFLFALGPGGEDAAGKRTKRGVIKKTYIVSFAKVGAGPRQRKGTAALHGSLKVVKLNWVCRRRELTPACPERKEEDTAGTARGVRKLLEAMEFGRDREGERKQPCTRLGSDSVQKDTLQPTLRGEDSSERAGSY